MLVCLCTHFREALFALFIIPVLYSLVLCLTLFQKQYALVGQAGGAIEETSCFSLKLQREGLRMIEDLFIIKNSLLHKPHHRLIPSYVN